MGRPVALEEVQTMTIASIKALEGNGGESSSSNDSSSSTDDSSAAEADATAAPVLQPAHVIDITRDLPTSCVVQAPERVRGQEGRLGGMRISDSALSFDLLTLSERKGRDAKPSPRRGRQVRGSPFGGCTLPCC